MEQVTIKTLADVQSYEMALIDSITSLCKNAASEGCIMPRVGTDFLALVFDEDDYLAATYIDGVGKLDGAIYNYPEEFEAMCSIGSFLESDEKYYDSSEGSWNDLAKSIIKAFVDGADEEKETFIDERNFRVIEIAKQVI